MAYADPTRMYNHILDILNAAAEGAWGGDVSDGRRSQDAIENARIQSGMEVLRAISMNPENGHYGALVQDIAVEHNTQIPDHDGETGIPKIVPFDGSAAREGIPADPDEIDSYRNDTLGLYSAALDGTSVLHDQPDQNNLPSPVSLKYSIVAGRFKFTGLSAVIPMIQLTREMADAQIPENYEPTVVKLSIAKTVKEGDNLYQYAQAYAQAGQQDLMQIMSGALQVSPVPEIAMAQKNL